MCRVLNILQLIGDATQGTGTPTFLANTTDFKVPLANQTLHWAPLTDGWDGFSLLVDDVERYVGDALNYSLGGLQTGIPHFFRIAVRVARVLSSCSIAHHGSVYQRGQRWRLYPSSDAVAEWNMGRPTSRS
jgi:hypothetical protein